MKPSRLQLAISESRPASNVFLTVPSAFSAEIAASLGYDCVTIDMQHGMISESDAIQMLQAISAQRSTPLARISWNSPQNVMRILDAGCYGIICPMVSSASDARTLVEAAYYHPLGHRSMGAPRGELYGGMDYYEAANGTVCVLPMIETLEGVRNACEIAAVPGVTGLYVGPNDLSVAMGLGRCRDPIFPELLDAISRIHDAAREAGKIICIHTQSVPTACKFKALGYDLVTLGNDARQLRGALAENLSSVFAE